MDEPVTVVTGTRTGIGKHLARHFLSLGHRVIGCSRTQPDWAAPGYTHVVLDVADEGAVVRMFADVQERYGRVDHLVNNAGIASMNHSLLTPVPRVRALLETNVLGTFLVSREAAKLMQRRKFGRIVNFSSVAVPLHLEGEAAYAASKAAVVSLTAVMARELGPLGITVNAVGPTPVDTGLLHGVPPDRVEGLVRRQAVRRLGTAEDVANVVEFFLRPQSGLVTGQTVYLGGP